jgi:hypothetical protein
MRTKKPMPADMGRRKMTKEEAKALVSYYPNPKPREGMSKREYARREKELFKEMRRMTPDQRAEIYRIGRTL